MTDSAQDQPVQAPTARRSAYDSSFEERGIDPVTIAAAAAIVKTVDVVGDVVVDKIKAIRNPPPPPPSSGQQ